jgi:hypothetical protein
VAERRLAERQEGEPDAGRQVVRVAGEVRPAERGSGADRAHHVADQREVQHLLDRDPGQHLLPAGHRAGLLGGQALVRVGLQAVAGVQVLAHDHVLHLGRLGEQVPQVLAVLDGDRGLSHQSAFRPTPP